MMIKVAVGLSLALAAVVPLATRSEYAVNLLILFFLYVIVAQSWNLLGGFAGQVPAEVLRQRGSARKPEGKGIFGCNGP